MAEGRRAQRSERPDLRKDPRVHLAGVGLGIVLTAVVWFFLVSASIDFGVAAVHGQPVAWVFSLGAALGAVVCLALVLALVGRGMRTLGFISDYKPRRAAARKRD